MNLLRYVNLAFVAAGLLIWVVSAEAYAAMIEWFAPAWNRPLLGADFLISDLGGLLSGLAGAFVLWRRDDIRTGTYDVFSELSRVTWPGYDETKVSTFVVILVTIIVSIFLAFFDYVWAWATSLIYGV